MKESVERVERIALELERIVDEAIERWSAVDEERASAKPAPGKWSYKEIVGHLIDSASNNHQRFIRAPQESPFLFPGYRQDEWVRQQAYNDCKWTALTAFWRMYNRHIAHVIRKIGADELAVECRIGTYEPVTLGYLIEDYLVHLKHHLNALP